MESIKQLYKTGRGPSSSHTIAPARACYYFMRLNGSFPRYEAYLYGSLSLTGKGHNTDGIIKESLDGPCDVYFCNDWDEDFPNGFILRGLDEDGKPKASWTVYSVGGGSFEVKGIEKPIDRYVYKEESFEEIRQKIREEGKTLINYIYDNDDVHDYLRDILSDMDKCVKAGLSKEGMLPGALKLRRCAKGLYEEALAEESDDPSLRLMAYAYAANEENADGGWCVTAPTLGSCGVMASLMYWLRHDQHVEEATLINALAVGGLFGNLIKTNATISGAVGGCQAEVGTAVSMASAAYAYVLGLSDEQIEYAAEIGMEHHLGLTCDPVMGYVMIPCIERNAMGVLRAIDAAELSRHMSKLKEHLISFDMVVKTMKETGKKIPIELKETSTGGLALEYGSK